MAAASKRQVIILEMLRCIFIFFISLFYLGHIWSCLDTEHCRFLLTSMSTTSISWKTLNSARRCLPSSGISKSLPLTLGFATCNCGVTVLACSAAALELHWAESRLWVAVSPRSLLCTCVKRRINHWEHRSCFPPLRGLPGCGSEFRAMRLPLELGKRNGRLSRLLFSILDSHLLF